MKLRGKVGSIALIIVASFALVSTSASAIGSQQNPQTGAFGFEGTVPGNPPKQGAIITIPANGQTFTNVPITVAGLCPTGLLIKVFSNNVFIGSTVCANGSFNIKVGLFAGRNDLVARDFDALDQEGPDSNVVTVTFNSAQFARFGTQITLSSNYARLGANPNATLTWPLILSGGTAPYAISSDWGDGSSSSLKSLSFPGVFNMNHVYHQAGVYTIIFKATDANGSTAYLQVVGVANGKISGGLTQTNGSQTVTSRVTVILWQPMVATIPLLIIAFWLGRRHELYVLRRTLESTRRQ